MNKKIILVHGLPGSGKSTLAEKLAKESGAVIFTTDDFYMKDGKYQFDFNFIRAAHDWNFGRFALAIFNGLEQAIIANTNLQAWSMAKYVELTAPLGFDFEIVEPKTKWRYDAAELAKRNTHGVPLTTIEKMLKDREDPKKIEAELRRKYYK